MSASAFDDFIARVFGRAATATSCCPSENDEALRWEGRRRMPFLEKIHKKRSSPGSKADACLVSRGARGLDTRH